MNGFKNALLIIAIFSVSSLTYGRARIKNISFDQNKGDTATIVISYTGELKETPELKVTSTMVQVVVSNSIVWPKIEKSISISGADSTLMAYQYNKELVRVRTMTPYSLVGREGQVSMMLKENKILITFPVLKATKMTRAPAITKEVKVTKTSKKAPKNQANKYDESYLEKLLTDKEKVAPVENKVAVLTDVKKVDEDKVAIALSATEKGSIENRGSRDMMLAMIGKFAGFLVLVLGLFYGVVALLRKGVIKKGKLGFLNNTDVVSVLNTTYIAPKKRIMMVKVHKQVFLLANDEKGIHFLSEVGDLTGLLKDGEEAISGTNFDSTLGTANSVEKEFKLKEVELPSQEVEGANLASFLNESPVKDQVKLSDQIKKKVKGLKQLQ